MYINNYIPDAISVNNDIPDYRPVRRGDQVDGYYYCVHYRYRLRKHIEWTRERNEHMQPHKEQVAGTTVWLHG